MCRLYLAARFWCFTLEDGRKMSYVNHEAYLPLQCRSLMRCWDCSVVFVFRASSLLGVPYAERCCDLKTSRGCAVSVSCGGTPGKRSFLVFTMKIRTTDCACPHRLYGVVSVNFVRLSLHSALCTQWPRVRVHCAVYRSRVCIPRADRCFYSPMRFVVTV